jgi:hypothetical protein
LSFSFTNILNHFSITIITLTSSSVPYLPRQNSANLLHITLLNEPRSHYISLNRLPFKNHSFILLHIWLQNITHFFVEPSKTTL